MRNKYATHVDFRFLSPYLGNKIPSNWDMVLERKGYFLVAEWKRENEQLSIGQEILLKQLAKQDKFTVLIVNGHSDNDNTEVTKFSLLGKDGISVKMGDNPDALGRFLKFWMDNVESL